MVINQGLTTGEVILLKSQAHYKYSTWHLGANVGHFFQKQILNDPGEFFKIKPAHGGYIFGFFTTWS